MKVSLNWLKDYTDITSPSVDIAKKLTMAGIEVKDMQVIGGAWDGIIIAKIINVGPHPNADRLKLAAVDLGTGQQTVVCGAPNCRAGDKVVFAGVGAQLTDPHTGEVIKLKPAKIRGVVSSGMICSEKELGISESHEGIMVLPEDAPVGKPLADYLGDTIFDLEVTPNRPDCLSVIGLAREVAASIGQSLRYPEIGYQETGAPIEQQVSVEILAPDLCPRYCASLISGIKIAESPVWMQKRLLACGMRPINNIVDITNYVMLEYGQPLHAFDFQLIRGRKIIVRRVLPGEVITSLDGTERKLAESMLVIADEKDTVAIAGVMGGANSEVTGGTTTILLESANFNPASIHYTGNALNLPSEARTRFERGIRPELTIPALKRATRLMIEIAGGQAAKGIIDVYPGKTEPKPILLSTYKVKKVLGIEFSMKQTVDVLKALGFECKTADSASEVRVTAPYWRSDINQAVDLVEEVARIVGYDAIPTTMLSQPIPRQNPEPITKLKQKARLSLTACGFQEVVTYSLVSLELLNELLPEPHPFEPMPYRMANPMTVEQEYLRPNLRINLLTALSSNRRYEEGGIRLFELGKVYLPDEKSLPNQPEWIGGVLSGARYDKSCWSCDEVIDFFDAKGAVEYLFTALGVEVNFEKGNDESLHPNKQLAIIAGGKRLGVLGELHPKVAVAFDLGENPVYLFELDLTALESFTLAHRRYQPVPRFPGIVRDIALLVDFDISHQKILETIRSFALVQSVILFDVYSGEKVPPNKKSLAYRIAFQSPTQTLTDEEANKVQQQILAKLQKEVGAILRS